MKYSWETLPEYYERLAEQCCEFGDYENERYYNWLVEEYRKEEQEGNVL